MSDDYCLLSFDPEPRAYNLYSTAKWRKDAVIVPDWLAQAAPHAVDGSERKNILRLDLIRPDRLTEKLTVKAIIVPALTDGGEAVLERIPQPLGAASPGDEHPGRRPRWTGQGRSS